MEENLNCGYISVSLTSKGCYTWKINLPVKTTQEEEINKTINRLKKIDNSLRDNFPRHAGFNQTSFKAFKHQI